MRSVLLPGALTTYNPLVARDINGPALLCWLVTRATTRNQYEEAGLSSWLDAGCWTLDTRRWTRKQTSYRGTEMDEYITSSTPCHCRVVNDTSETRNTGRRKKKGDGRRKGDGRWKEGRWKVEEGRWRKGGRLKVGIRKRELKKAEDGGTFSRSNAPLSPYMHTQPTVHPISSCNAMISVEADVSCG